MINFVYFMSINGTEKKCGITYHRPPTDSCAKSMRGGSMPPSIAAAPGVMISSTASYVCFGRASGGTGWKDWLPALLSPLLGFFLPDARGVLMSSSRFCAATVGVARGGTKMVLAISFNPFDGGNEGDALNIGNGAN